MIQDKDSLNSKVSQPKPRSILAGNLLDMSKSLLNTQPLHQHGQLNVNHFTILKPVSHNTKPMHGIQKEVKPVSTKHFTNSHTEDEPLITTSYHLNTTTSPNLIHSTSHGGPNLYFPPLTPPLSPLPQSPPPQIPHPPPIYQPPLPLNLDLIVDQVHMIFPDVEVWNEYQLYLATVFEIVPRYKCVDLALELCPIVNPLTLVYSINLTAYQPLWTTTTVGEQDMALIRELMGVVIPPIDFHPLTKIIT